MKKKRDYGKLVFKAVIVVLCIFFLGGIGIGAERILQMEGTVIPYKPADSLSVTPETKEAMLTYVNKAIVAAGAGEAKLTSDDDCEIDNDTIDTNGNDRLYASFLYIKNDFIDVLESTGELYSADYGESFTAEVKELSLNPDDITDAICDCTYYVCPICGKDCDDIPEDGICPECGGNEPFDWRFNDEYEIVFQLADGCDSVKNNFRFRSEAELKEVIDRANDTFTAQLPAIVYKDAKITAKINRLTDKLTGLSFSFTAEVSTDISFIGDYSVLGTVPVKFAVKETSARNITWPELSLSAHEMTLEKKTTDNLEATLTCDDATKYDISWTIDDENIATVDDAGYITSKKTTGTATVTASFEFNGKTYSDSCVISVRVPVEGLDISKRSLSLTVGEEFSLTTKTSPKKATIQTVKWYSGDESIATVDADGNVKAVGEGTVTVYALSDDGYYKSSCKVEVAK